MNIKPIKTEAEYITALKKLETIGDDERFENSEELQTKFELLSKAIELYEKSHYPIKKGHPIEIIKIRMENLGLTRSDIIDCIGSKGVMSDVFTLKRKLSKKMIRDLSKKLNISQEILNTDYELMVNSKTKGSASFSKVLFENISESDLERVKGFQEKIYRRRVFLKVAC